jgi:two-component system cell cycle sensor histidine kinase/response regulator CckA
MKKILVVDNDQFFLEFIKELLQKDGHEVQTAEDGLSALDVLDGFTPDFIFSDVIMPNIDGKRLCRILRRMNHLRDTKIIMVSSVVSESFDELKTCGADRCISKGPFEQMARDILGFLGQSGPPSLPVLPETSSGGRLRPRAITRELLSQNRHLESLLDRLSEAIFEVTSGRRIVYANSAATRLTQISEEQLLGCPFQNIFSKKDRSRIETLLERLGENPGRFTADPLPEVNGHEVLLEAVPIKKGSGKKLLILENVSEQKAAVRALKKSEERYRILFENATDAIFIIQDDILKFPNRRTLEGLGCSVEELSRTPFTDFVHPEDRESAITRYHKRLRGESVPAYTSFRGIKKSGEEFWAELNGVLINWENRPATLNFLRDVTERVEIEGRLRQKQRMESVGRLAGGVAHDFNNLLMAIQGNTTLLLLDRDPTDADYVRLKNIEQYVQTGSELTRQLLGFARGGKYETKVTNLNELIGRNCEMLERNRKEIRIQQKYQTGLWKVAVDRGQMDQVLMNLFINAWQALSGGGELMVETRNVQLEEGDEVSADLPAGKYVEISVADTGTGMDEETRLNAFDPFFTTREPRRGTGLGLASCYGIIKNHQGRIDVKSTPGKGTVFKILLPAVENSKD